MRLQILVKISGQPAVLVIPVAVQSVVQLMIQIVLKLSNVGMQNTSIFLGIQTRLKSSVNALKAAMDIKVIVLSGQSQQFISILTLQTMKTGQ
jgi:hypothetical protein